MRDGSVGIDTEGQNDQNGLLSIQICTRHVVIFELTNDEKLDKFTDSALRIRTPKGMCSAMIVNR